MDTHHETDPDPHLPKQEESHDKISSMWGVIIFSLFVVLALAIFGYYRQKNRQTADSNSQNLADTSTLNTNAHPFIQQGVPYIPPQILGNGTSTPRNSQTSTTTPGQSQNIQNTPANYQNQKLGFSTVIPSGWKTLSQTGDEVVFESLGKTRYSVQVYPANNTDWSFVKSNLQSLPNIHNLSDASVAGYQAEHFDIDGIYSQGYAFLNNGRLYYILGKSLPPAFLSNFTAY
jgi:hypothetical protein